MSPALLLAAISTLHSAAWQLERKQDPINDSVDIHTVLSGPQGAIAFGCSGTNHRYIMLVSKTYLGGRGGHPFMRDIVLRFDDRPAKTYHWIYSDSYVLSAGDEDRVAAEGAVSQKLVVRASTFRDQIVDMTFDLRGAANELALLDLACRKQFGR